MQIEGSDASLRRVFLLAAVLPAAMVLVDRLAIPAMEAGGARRIGVYALLIGQVGLLSWLAGRGLSRPVFCWTVYAWGLVLLDLWVLSLVPAHRSDDPLSYAMISAQAGLMAVWAILGTGMWQWRLPMILVVAVLLGYFYLPTDDDLVDGWGRLRDSDWSTVLLIQCFTIAAVSVVLRVLGFRLRRAALPAEQQDPARPNDYRQFNIRHMLVWTTVVPVILVLTKGVDWLFFRDSPWFELLLALLLGVIVALVSLIAIWSALGRSDWRLRVSVLMVAPPLLGASAGWFLEKARNSLALGRWVSFIMRGDIVVWIAWMALAAGLLAAMLLIFRARGYRLMREAE